VTETKSLHTANPWALPVEDVLEDLAVSPQQGLSEQDVKKRRERFGPNRLREAERRSVWDILASQFKSLVVLLLAAAALLAFAFGNRLESGAITAVILINTAIGFAIERHAVRSMEALRHLDRVTAKVRRDGKVVELPAEELVPGDIVLLEGGDRVSADIRLIESSKLQADESALTGESLPVGKRVEVLPSDEILAQRKNMLFKGTSVTRGSAAGVVVATGMQTEIGEISFLTEQAEAEVTPLEKRLDQLGRRLIWVALAFAVVVAGAGIWTGKDAILMIETSIALAVAAIPEGLPIVATIALGRGMLRMARRHALIRRLSAVETLGATEVICTDKTGTLTENKMAVRRILLDQLEVRVEDEEPWFRSDRGPVPVDEDPRLQQALMVGVLCNNAALRARGEDRKTAAVGDPLEVALLELGAKGGVAREALVEKMPEVREEAFDPEIKMMATYHESDESYYVAVKGAPEAVLRVSSRQLTAEGDQELTEKDRDRWLERVDRLARNGLRLLAVARKEVSSLRVPPYEDLTVIGVLGLQDPPRGDVAKALQECREAGIRVVMVTGDQASTARSIAETLGLAEGESLTSVNGKELDDSVEQPERFLGATVFARVSPRQKLGLIEMYQRAGHVVAMTGDGVNDAPALKKADIGIAMGQRGTQVAKEAADMVIKDDSFVTIVSAIRQGRVIFDNIRKFVFYLLSCNASEILLVASASLINAPLPILPLQILFLNLVTDVFPALALGVGEGDPTVMKRPPRNPQESILRADHWWGVVGYGALITLSVLGAFWLALSRLDMSDQEAVTASFLTLAFAQLWHVFNMRGRGSRWLENDVVRNPFVWGALLLCTGLLVVAVYVPWVAEALDTRALTFTGWSVALSLSLVPLVVGQALKSSRSVYLSRP
jgi:Ca2+-transporting ATPase